MIAVAEQRFQPDAILDLVEAEGVTSVFLVPTQWQALCSEPGVATRNLRRLRVLGWGAAPASDTLLRRMADTFPDAMNVALFGQTEMSPVTCVLHGKDAIRKLGSVGRPIAAVTAHVCAEPSGEPDISSRAAASNVPVVPMAT